ncbi:unnamed protein product [Linum trigynum]|uniref:Uncharacterized protein n=1 Tax=Linum trigynum TaxID=586398 RepID=A0AAV2GM13_9ROSI
MDFHSPYLIENQNIELYGGWEIDFQSPTGSRLGAARGRLGAAAGSSSALLAGRQRQERSSIGGRLGAAGSGARRSPVAGEDEGQAASLFFYSQAVEQAVADSLDCWRRSAIKELEG